MRSRNAMIQLAQSWVGKKESDGSFKEIINIYNSYKPLPRGYKLKYTDSWCAGTMSALAIKLGYTDIIPIEVSCGNMIQLAKNMGIWQENDAYIPSPADMILYDWQDTGVGDNTGWPDHIGLVEKVVNSTITIIEGNYKDAVDRRTIAVNGKYIRGYITPKYDDSSNTTESAKNTNQNDSNAKKIWTALTSSGYSKIASAALLGNWDAESGLKPNNLQNTFEKKLGMTDQQYSDKVSNGTYTKNQFVRDSAGYGLAQWTYWSRKQAMYEYIIEQKKKRIDDLTEQINFAIDELGKNYKPLVVKLNGAKTVREASDLVLTQYEKPANQSESVKQKRASLSQRYFNLFA